MIEIRKAYPTDAYSLVAIQDDVFRSIYYDVVSNGIFNEMSRTLNGRVNHLKDQIRENNRIFVAVDKETIIGYIFYAKVQNNTSSTAAEIRSIYLLQNYQRQGIGTELFLAAIDELKKLGYRSLIVDCPKGGLAVEFFEKMGGQRKEIVSRMFYGYPVQCDVLCFSLDEVEVEDNGLGWNEMFSLAQDKLNILNDVNREIAVILSNDNKIYYGLGIEGQVCAVASAISNMLHDGEAQVCKILILNRISQLVLPCDKCCDLLINSGSSKAQILFDIGSFRTMTIEELVSNKSGETEEKA